MPAKAKATRKPAPAFATIADVENAIMISYQQRWARDTARFLCGVWARQTGKSFSTAEIIAKDVAGRPKVAWMIAAPSERQSVESLAKVKEWLRAINVAFEEDVEHLHDPKETVGSITLANGSRVIAVPGKPDTVRGFSGNVWMDEFAFFENPEATWKAILPSITNPLRGGQKRVIITSTPNGKTGRGKRFYEIVSNPDKGKIRWSVHKNPLRQCIAEGLPVDYDELYDVIDDPLAAAQELDCEFLDGSNVLLPMELITAAESPDAGQFADDELLTPGHHRQLYMGVDFGRTNDPTVSWMVEKVGDVLITREVLVLRNTASDEQEQILARRLAVAQRCCFDYTGPGIGLGDYLVRAFGEYNAADHKLQGKVEKCVFTTPFKRQIFPRLRRKFEAPVTVRIPAAQDIRDDLYQMQQIVSGDSISYASGRVLDGNGNSTHSDRCTALALAVRAASGDTGVIQFSSLGGVRLGSTRGQSQAAPAGTVQKLLRKFGFR